MLSLLGILLTLRRRNKYSVWLLLQILAINIKIILVLGFKQTKNFLGIFSVVFM